MLLSTALMCSVKASTSYVLILSQVPSTYLNQQLAAVPVKEIEALLYTASKLRLATIRDTGKAMAQLCSCLWKPYLYQKYVVIRKRSSRAQTWSGMELVLLDRMFSCSSHVLTVFCFWGGNVCEEWSDILGYHGFICLQFNFSNLVSKTLGVFDLVWSVTNQGS